MIYEPSTETTYNTIQEFRLAHPNTSFGDFDTEEELNHFGLFTIHHERFSHNPQTQICKEGPIKFVNGRWTKTNIIEERPMTHEEKAGIFTSNFQARLDGHFDSVAIMRQYDNRASVLLKTGYPGPFQKEAVAFATWMDECSVVCYEIMNAVKTGERAIPADCMPFINELPACPW